MWADYCYSFTVAFSDELHLSNFVAALPELERYDIHLFIYQDSIICNISTCLSVIAIMSLFVVCIRLALICSVPRVCTCLVTVALVCRSNHLEYFPFRHFQFPFHMLFSSQSQSIFLQPRFRPSYSPPTQYLRFSVFFFC